MPTIYDMIKEHLEQEGYDGLCNAQHQCCCGIDNLFSACPALDVDVYVTVEDRPCLECCAGHAEPKQPCAGSYTILPGKRPEGDPK